MGSLWLIEELCGICTEMSHIIHTQAVALEQLGAMCMEEERVEIGQRFSAIIDIQEMQNQQGGAL